MTEVHPTNIDLDGVLDRIATALRMQYEPIVRQQLPDGWWALVGRLDQIELTPSRNTMTAREK